MRRWVWLLAASVALVLAPWPAAAQPGDQRAAARPEEPVRWVFLVHGILMGTGSMEYLAQRLEAEGYTAVNRGYPSTSLTIQESGEFLRRRIERRLANDPDAEVNIVTHSMGGLLARYYLTHYPPKNFGALVMIAPPNQAADKASRFKDFFFYRWLYGTPGQQLANDLHDDLQKVLGVPTQTFGIIAGGTGDEDGFTPTIPGDDDGTISVEHTKLPGAADFIVLRYPHAFIMRKRETADQVIYFLAHGRFKHDKPKAEGAAAP